ncbi:uncharacterized protein isoform X2 [Musca autumnalis]|uniref:uncharacterized protein isoform X2 n=1 Tax=Musca autumnalis TaxID=221902 RepID=UPI003CEDB3D3
MGAAVKPYAILRVLKDIEEPAHLTEVVEHLVKTFYLPLNGLMQKAKRALEDGIRYGFIEKRNELYFLPENETKARARAEVAGRSSRRRVASGSARGQNSKNLWRKMCLGNMPS